MKREKIEKRIDKALKSGSMCLLETTVENEPYRFLPVKVGKELVIGIKDNDFSANGYSIINIDDIEKAKVLDSVAGESKDDQTENLEINLDSWEAALTQIADCGRVVIVECDHASKKDDRYLIGKIESISKKNLDVAYYGPDKTWSGKKWKVDLGDITQVTTRSRYTEVLRSYLPKEEK